MTSSISLLCKRFYSSSSSKTPAIPLHTEWSKLVSKELKGKDPLTLTWKTAEVFHK